MFRFHKEGKASITLVGLVCIGILAATWLLIPSDLFWLQIVLTFVAFDLLIFILQFFRNPIRQIAKQDDSIIYAPADGKIVVIEETTEHEFLKEKCIQVSIFMSPLNVHVNRNPISGTVQYSKYHPGKFLMAWNPKASTENERTTVAYQLKNGQQLVMRQIAGFLARRIVNYLKAGDQVKQGEDMGFIKLGSRVDLFLPLGTEINVKLDDMVQGNLSVIGHLK
ncbi:phosphatidylserine decarboxylase family protein [Aureispira anguillae]|uniref:Phosphatidylserine decarboxylase proenzyme n=1 Tax=Aureispira anguillae TaxID=2864201 RepID=A0A916DWH7_9BACT|nr:phosphatidylserine decarboxylase family protein [Aureispira anguillae]BDS14051.1 phosphatidylserine decarboxylase family protein [Aureispira anguillae]